VVDAKLLLASESGSRLVNIEDFYLGHKKTDLRWTNDRGILIPKADLSNYYYMKVGPRNALAISRVSFRRRICNGRRKDCHKRPCAFGAVADVVLGLKNWEKMLIGKT
jgi:CO/xanthine dehydrogenase FAD-binding subunit